MHGIFSNIIIRDASLNMHLKFLKSIAWENRYNDMVDTNDCYYDYVEKIDKKIEDAIYRRLNRLKTRQRMRPKW